MSSLKYGVPRVSKGSNQLGALPPKLTVYPAPDGPLSTAGPDAIRKAELRLGMVQDNRNFPKPLHEMTGIELAFYFDYWFQLEATLEQHGYDADARLPIMHLWRYSKCGVKCRCCDLEVRKDG